MLVENARNIWPYPTAKSGISRLARDIC